MVISIPLAVGAVLALWLTGQTINLMTLGGLALAVGILVDMSTVAISIHAFAQASARRERSLIGKRVALPLLIAMLCVLAVFIPSSSGRRGQGVVRAVVVGTVFQ